MIDKTIENKFIVKLLKRLESEGIDVATLKKEKEFDDEIDYRLGDLGIAIFIDSELPQFHIFWQTSLGQKYLPYEKWAFKNLDEHMNCFIDDVMIYYTDPDKRLNPVLKLFNRWLDNKGEFTSFGEFKGWTR